MATRKLFVPLILSCIGEFEEWLHETQNLQCLTDLGKDKQARSHNLSVSGQED